MSVVVQNPKDTPPPTRVETKEEKKERKVTGFCFIFRSTLLSQPNKVGLRCLFVRPSVHIKFL